VPDDRGFSASLQAEGGYPVWKINVPVQARVTCVTIAMADVNPLEAAGIGSLVSLDTEQEQ
jgi:hypothetical protein